MLSFITCFHSQGIDNVLLMKIVVGVYSSMRQLLFKVQIEDVIGKLFQMTRNAYKNSYDENGMTKETNVGV